VVCLLTIVFVALLGRVVQLRCWPSERLQQHLVAREGRSTLLARRGTLLDRAGRVIATSEIGYRLFVDPQLIDDPSTFATHLAHQVGLDPAEVDQAIGSSSSRRFVVIRESVTQRQKQAVHRWDHPAVGLQARQVRQYPAGPLAGQLVGFVGHEQSGLDGLEHVWQPQLSGRNGRLRFAADVRNQPVWVPPSAYRPPRDGQDRRLSIDLVIQSCAEEVLGEAVERYGARAGEVVVMDSRDGQLLALANWPRFDPAAGGNVPPELRRNRCVTDPYEPGSIFKPFIHAAALESGVVRPEEIIDCTESGFTVTAGGRRLRDARGHGRIDWDQVLVESSNIGMAIVGQRLGTARMAAAVDRFGFGRITGSGLPGESAGIVRPARKWNHYSVTSIPMGQEIAATPLQMVRAFSAFANGGLMVCPTILADEDGRPILQRAIERNAADHVRQVLRRVVSDERGTGRRARSQRYAIWGKTGTAQVPDRVHGGYLEKAYTASFVCGAPLRHPRLIVLVVIHEPDPKIGYYGGTVAAPVAREVVDRTLTYLGVPPDLPNSSDAPDEYDGSVVSRPRRSAQPEG
jgi:cell division protein FtsI/penicillin-binding protein 2